MLSLPKHMNPYTFRQGSPEFIEGLSTNGFMDKAGHINNTAPELARRSRDRLELKLARQSPRTLLYGEESPGSTEQDAG